MDELIKELRYCAEHDGCDYYIAKDCPSVATWVCGVDCEQILMRDAADAIERLMDERDKLREAYNAVHKEYGKECYAFRFGYLDQTVKLILGITEDNNEQ